MQSQWKAVLFWICAILLVVAATMLYQPAAARTGSLLVWTNDRVYVMDIDTLTLERVGPAALGEPVSPSPGCGGKADAPCWVAVSNRLYRVDVGAGSSEVVESRLPVGDGFQWQNSALSWSPEGRHVAYSVRNETSGESQLRVVDASSGQTVIQADDVDPDVAAAWSSGCAQDLNAETCELGYKKMPGQKGRGFLATLVGFKPGSQAVRQWSVTPEPLYALRWANDGTLLYSRPKRHFIRADDHTPAYSMPPGGQLANMSPDGDFTVYYQPFTLQDCANTTDSNNCMHLGVWLESSTPAEDVSTGERDLIYNIALAQQRGGLNFIPSWSPFSEAFVFFHDGNLIHYDIAKGEATIWYKDMFGKLRSTPVFSPNEEAVAFVDNQGQGYSDYRLVVVNPRLQPVEHIIESGSGFRVLAWLPN